MDRLTDRMTFAILESLLGLKTPNLYPPSCLTVMSVIRNGHLNLNGEVQIRMGHLGSDLFGVSQEELLHICHPIYRWQIIGTIASFCTLLETEPLPCLYILTRLSV